MHDIILLIKEVSLKVCILVTAFALLLKQPIFYIKKTFDDNLALEIDIRKDFKIIDWSFLDRVLKGFGGKGKNFYLRWSMVDLHLACK